MVYFLPYKSFDLNYKYKSIFVSQLDVLESFLLTKVDLLTAMNKKTS